MTGFSGPVLYDQAFRARNPNSMGRRKLLLVAYHFPPIQGSTGISRTLAFARYLREFDWDVCVLTIRPEAYEDRSEENDKLVPEHVRVERAWGVDTRSSLAIRNKYPMLLAVPDRWQSWILGAYRRGSRVIREWRPDVIMSTYPIASAHVIGRLLSARFSLPWLAEFRDPMLQPSYPHDRLERWAYKNIESNVFRQASHVVVTTDGCRRLYAERYPEFPAARIHTVSNGYDPVLFPDTGSTDGPESNGSGAKIVILHSGLLYPHERNPTFFFEAVRRLASAGILDGVEFRLRASGNEQQYRSQLDELGIDQFVRLESRLPYIEAVTEMRSADGLLLFQAESCNQQIPAKVYEYLYCKKPILGLADPAGDTGQFLRSVGVDSVAKLEDVDEIESKLATFVDAVRLRSAFVVPDEVVQRYSRQALSGDLCSILDSIAATA